MTPTPDAVRERIYKTFVDGWLTTSPFTLDGEDYDPAFDTDFVRLAVRFDASDQGTLGTVGDRKYIRGGNIILQCFQPNGTGTARSTVLAKTGAGLFEGKKLGVGTENVDVFEATIVDIGPGEFWHQVNMTARFEYEELG